MALPPASDSSTALVTGASSGIGQAFAHGLARRGHGVTLVARGAEGLAAVAAELEREHRVRADFVAADLADPDQRDELAAEVERRGRAVEVLVNAAGFGVYAPIVRAIERRSCSRSGCSSKPWSTSRPATCPGWSSAVGAR